MWCSHRADNEGIAIVTSDLTICGILYTSNVGIIRKTMLKVNELAPHWEITCPPFDGLVSSALPSRLFNYPIPVASN